MALENEALLLKQAVRAGVLDADKGTAALYVYSQLKQMGAKFSFGQFLAERGLLSQMALGALEASGGQQVQTVSHVGDFELLEQIGEGQNGVVFRALQKSLQRPVAVKILNAGFAANPEALQRFQNEARATARLNHPNVVLGINVGSDQGLHYFAMELVEGGSAASLLKSSGAALDEVSALNIIRQAAEGLKAAHAAGLVHRDLKPDNILLTKDGVAKLADLGISQNLQLAQQGDESGEFWASPPYVAPEVILGHAENDPRSDIYSLGATLFELLAGHPPFEGETPQEIMQQHVNAPIPDILSIRPDLTIQTSSLLKRMLAKDPADRVPSAAIVADSIARIIALKQQPAPAAQPQAPPAPPARRPAAPRPRAARRGNTAPAAPRPAFPKLAPRPAATRPGQSRPMQRPGAPRPKPRGRP